jgi:hypothetical protein
MYDATLGRFIARDPVGFADTVSAYAYVHNAPPDGLDPTGLADFSDWRTMDDYSLMEKMTSFYGDVKDKKDEVTQENVRDFLEVAEQHKDPGIRNDAVIMLACEGAREALIKYLSARLKPVKAPDLVCCSPKEVAKLIVDLESDNYLARTKAAQTLEKCSGTVLPLLRAHLKSGPTLDLTRRLEKIIARIEANYLATSAQRTMLEVLARIGPADQRVREILTAMAGGWALSEVTWLARVALGSYGIFSVPSWTIGLFLSTAR